MTATDTMTRPGRFLGWWERLNGVTSSIEAGAEGELRCTSTVTGLNRFAIGFTLIFVPLAALLAIVFWNAGEPWAAAIPGGLGIVALVLVPLTIYFAWKRRLCTELVVRDGIASWQVDLPFPLSGHAQGSVELSQVESIETRFDENGGVFSLTFRLRDGQGVPVPVALSSALAQSWKSAFQQSLRHWRPDLVDALP